VVMQSSVQAARSEAVKKDKSKEQEMKRSVVMGATPAGRSLRVLLTSAMLLAALTVTYVVVSPSGALATTSVRNGDAGQLFYTTSGAGNGLPNGAEIWAISVSGSKVTTRDVGPTFGGDCGSLALSPHGTLYSMCGSLFGAQQLATIDQQTGSATLFGVPVSGLAVMAMAFGPDGTLYAVGDCNPNQSTFECNTPPSIPPDPTYNSLYKVDVKTTELVNLVGSNLVMGLAFGRNGKLYATDNFPNSGMYVIDDNTGFETAIAALPFGFSSDLVLMN